MGHSLVIRNCHPYNQAVGKPAVDVVVRNGTIVHIGRAGTNCDGQKVFDAGGRLLIPGLIDVHVHGAGGGDTSHGSEEALRAMSVSLARLGVTSFLATAMVRPEIENRHLRIVGELAGRNLGGANLLGLHLEGPFVSPARRGGIPLTSIERPALHTLDRLMETTGGTLRMMTIAPEVDGALEVIATLVDRGIVASFGHSDADYAETQRGIAAGISHVTHLFNTMRPLHHRDPGPIPAIFESPEVTVQLICDGVHLHEKTVCFSYRQLGGERCVCITDGMLAMGLPEGRYSYYGLEFESKDGVARYSDGTLIGTSTSLHQMMLNFKEFTGCPLSAAVDTAAMNPARVLGIDDRSGKLIIGQDADLVILNQDFSVWTTIIRGKVVYTKKEKS